MTLTLTTNVSGARGQEEWDVDLHAIEEIGAPVLAVERLCRACEQSGVVIVCGPAYSRHHGVDGGEMGRAGRAAVDALACEVTTVAHAHDW